jgi:hypothetical protein
MSGVSPSPVWIDLADHPSNGDPTALLVSSPRDVASIYRVKGGYLATDGKGRALDVLFGTQREAKEAILADLPPTITDWLERELGAKLATIPTAQAKHRFLIQQWNVWSEKRRRFAESNGDDGFWHPHYGHMHLSDYLTVLCMIDGAKSKLERQRVPA